MKTTKEILLKSKISDVLIDFANISKEDITTSDLQSVAMVKAIEIISIVKHSFLK